MGLKAVYTGFDYQTQDSDVVADIKKNIEALLSTPAGTVPGARDFGVDTSYIGMPIDVAKNQIAIDMIEKVSIYEPRAVVEEVTAAQQEDGNITFNILIGPNPEYDEEEYEEEDEDEEEEEEE